jgi:hypothetical protein
MMKIVLQGKAHQGDCAWCFQQDEVSDISVSVLRDNLYHTENQSVPSLMTWKCSKNNYEQPFETVFFSALQVTACSKR